MALFMVWTELAVAVEYPTKAVTIVVPFPPGGSADVQARLIGKGLAERLGKPVLIDNRPGAGGRIGAGLAARAVPDGHTLLFGSISTLVLEPVLRTNVGFDPQRDFAPITVVSEMPFLIVVSSSGATKSIADLLASARKQSGALTYASWGPGSAGHLLGEMLSSIAGIKILHVPYKGEAPAMMDLMGGQVSMMFVSSLAAMPHVRAGKLRALAVTGPRRLSALPDVPTLGESSIPGVDLMAWFGFVVPAKTPQDIVARLHKDITDVLNSREFVQWAVGQGVVVVASSPSTLAQRIQSESASIVKVVNSTKLNLDE